MQRMYSYTCNRDLCPVQYIKIVYSPQKSHETIPLNHML